MTDEPKFKDPFDWPLQATDMIQEHGPDAFCLAYLDWYENADKLPIMFKLSNQQIFENAAKLAERQAFQNMYLTLNSPTADTSAFAKHCRQVIRDIDCLIVLERVFLKAALEAKE